MQLLYMRQPGQRIILSVLVLFIAALGWWMSVSSYKEKCTTFDELIHLTAGYSYWKFNDYRLDAENGMLSQRLGALPLLFERVQFPSVTQSNWLSSNSLSLGYDLFYRLGNDPNRMLESARWAMGSLIALLVVVVFIWSKSIFGTAGGLISAIVCAFCPSVLAHGCLVTSDMAITAFFCASTFLFWKVIHHPGLPLLALSCLTFGLLLLSKMSSVLFIGVMIILTAVRLYSGRPMIFPRNQKVVPEKSHVKILCGILILHFLLGTLILWGSYGFRFSSMNPVQAPGRLPYKWEVLLSDHGIVESAVSTAKKFRLLPEGYLSGFMQIHKFTKYRPAYLNSQYSTEGWWYFFPYAILIKTPIPLLVVSLGASGFLFYLLLKGRKLKVTSETFDKLYEVIPLVVIIAIYLGVAITSNINIGHRHILPIYPPLFILAGVVSMWFAKQYIGRMTLVAALLLMHIAESVSIRPHYLAYFNRIGGGPEQGYKHLVDSSLDWGQDLPGLKKWLNQNGTNQAPVFLSYFGTGEPEFYGVKVNELYGYNFDELKNGGKIQKLEPGIFCISATMLAGPFTLGPWTESYERAYLDLQQKVKIVENTKSHPPEFVRQGWTRTKIIDGFNRLQLARLCTYLRKQNPDSHVGYSILIYHLSKEELKHALNEPLSAGL